MKLPICNPWTAPRCWAWWTVLAVFLLLVTPAQAGDLSDSGIGPPAATGSSHSDAVGTTTAGAPATVESGDRNPETSIGGVSPAEPSATGEGAGPGAKPAGFPAPEAPSESRVTADAGAEPGGGLRSDLEGSGATTGVSDARMTTQVAKAIGPALKAVRATAFAAIDYLRAQLAGAIRRIDPPPRGWTAAADTGTSEPASGIKLERRSELNPARGDARPAPETSTHQLTAHQITAGLNRLESEDPVSSSVNPGPAAGLGSAAQILIPIGLAAAACGCAAPAVRRRLSPRAGWLRSALLASSLEQPG
jgi:hypothetical protein